MRHVQCLDFNCLCSFFVNKRRCSMHAIYFNMVALNLLRYGAQNMSADQLHGDSKFNTYALAKTRSRPSHAAAH